MTSTLETPFIDADAVTLTGWLDDPSPTRGIRYLDEDDSWRRVPHVALAARVLRFRDALVARGLAGRRLGLLAADPENFITLLFAALAAGATCVPVTPLLPLRDPDEYLADAGAVLGVGRPAALLVTEADADAVLPAWPTIVVREDAAGRVTLDGEALFADDVQTLARDGEAPALIQFSSGSTGSPKGIRISRSALTANVRSICRWIVIGEQDKAATWLPLYHDMGLIGMAITPVVTQSDLLMMEPLQFLRRPDIWLRCFGELGATVAAAPAFGYAYAARKVALDDIQDCDFSAWRMAILGAEPIRRQAIDSFTDRFAPLGFQRRAFCPAYGLAEATLMATGTPVDKEPVLRSELGLPDEDDLPGANELVGSGTPMGGTRLVVVDEAGLPVPDGCRGEIWVGGPSLADGYEPESHSGFEDGWFKTGDMAVVVDGELFVHGRISDRFKVRGEMVLAEDAEYAIQQSLLLPVPPVVVPARSEGAGLTVLVESSREWDEPTRAEALAVIAGLFDGAEVDLVFVGRGGVPRTTSGKPRRRLCWRRHVLKEDV